MNVKCPSCGLVNFNDTDPCRRCGAPLSQGYAQEWQPSVPPDMGTAPMQNPSPYDPPSAYGTPGDDSYGGWQPGSTFVPGPSYGVPNPHYGTSFSSFGGYAGYGAAMPAMAERGTRLGAAILDSLVTYGPVMVGAFIGAAVDSRSEFLAIGLGLVALIVMVIVQTVLVTLHGQSIGKRALGIKVVKIDTGENGGFVTNVLMRNVVPLLIGFVPYLGGVFGLVDTLFIFREDRRCIHDLIAGTVVVYAR